MVLSRDESFGNQFSENEINTSHVLPQIGNFPYEKQTMHSYGVCTVQTEAMASFAHTRFGKIVLG